MKARVPHLGAGGFSLDGGGLDSIVPDGRFDIAEFFQLDSLTLSKSTVVPFEEVTVSWAISAKRSDIQPTDFGFTLYGPDENVLDHLGLSGSTIVRPRASSFLYLRGHKTGSASSPLGSPQILTVDQSSCQTVEIPKDFFDAAVNARLPQLSRSGSQIRLRNNDPVVSSWTAYSVRYVLPLKIVINNFFDADLDVVLTIAFRLSHTEASSDLDVSITDKTDVDFSTIEDILSLGSSSLIAKLIEKIVPLILACPIQLMEAAVLREILSYPAVRQALNEGKRLLDVRPVAMAGFEHLAITLCGLPEASPGHR